MHENATDSDSTAHEITQERVHEALQYTREYIHPDLRNVWKTYQRIYSAEVIISEHGEDFEGIVDAEVVHQELLDTRVAIEQALTEDYEAEIAWTFDELEDR